LGGYLLMLLAAGGLAIAGLRTRTQTVSVTG
jgi:hypothetical protein